MIDALGLPQEPGEFPERSATPVMLVAYDPRWPRLFEHEKRAILEALPPCAVRVEHVGSTAVPGLVAKPVLDMAVALDDIEHAASCIEPLAALGYIYVPEFEAELPNRRYFRKDARPLHRTHHIHMYQQDHPEFVDFLVFRDLLRADAAIRSAYEQLKFELAATHGRAEYTKAKGPFIKDALTRARR